MKKYYKDTWYMYVIVFVFCFMLFLYEPLTLFLNNATDFWFSFGAMFKHTFLLFFIVFVLCSAFFNAIYFLNKNKSKKIFKIFTIVMFIVLVCSYIQGNFLVGNLPLLDGTVIEWSNYKLDSIISIVLWILVIGVTVFVIKKFTLDKVVKYSGFVSLAIMIMLSLSFVTTLISNSKSLEKGITPLVTYKSINDYSKDKNFIILILDCVDSKSFYSRLTADDDFKDILHDFTYYPDTMGAYPFTKDAVPFILTGEYYLNEESPQEYATEAYKNSALFKMIEDNDYELNVYENYLLYYDESVNRINNIYDSKKAEELINSKKFWKQEIRDIIFKYSPFPLKKYSKIENMDFDVLYLQDKTDTLDNSFFTRNNYRMVKMIRNDGVNVTEKNNFKFIHLKGAHRPWEYNKTFHKRKVGTYFNEIDSCLTLVKEYLEMLKANGVYDNSAIIIMADHGCENKISGEQRRNPILFVKGMNEKNNKMNISDKMVHFSDLQELYSDLLAGKKSKDVFSNVPNKDRVRRYIDYENGNITADTLVEYESIGKAWENDKIHATGNVYRKKW